MLNVGPGFGPIGCGLVLAFRDIPPGASYSGAILEAIADSNVVVVILSSHTSESPYVLREIERAVDRRLPIVPVRIEDARRSRDLEYFLSAVQWIDAFPEIGDDVVRRRGRGAIEFNDPAPHPSPASEPGPRRPGRS